MWTCIKLVWTSPMLFSMFAYRCLFPFMHGNHFASSIYVHSHFRHFRHYTECNKFSGKTLNINLLLWVGFLVVDLAVLSMKCRHGCWQNMSDSGTSIRHYKVTKQTKKKNKKTNFNRTFLHEQAQMILTYFRCTLGDMHFSIQHPKFNARQCVVWHTQPLMVAFSFHLSCARHWIGWIFFHHC